MKARIIKIGNSRGVRIPHILLEESGLGDEIELESVAEGILIRPGKVPRRGWEDAFSRTIDRDADLELIDEYEAADGFDETDWQW